MKTARICAIILALTGTLWTVTYVGFLVVSGLAAGSPVYALAVSLPYFLAYGFWLVRSFNLWIKTWQPTAWAIVAIVCTAHVFLIAISDNLHWNRGSTAIIGGWWLLASGLSVVGLIADLKAHVQIEEIADSEEIPGSPEEFQQPST